MSDESVRLIDDPSVPEALRRDLMDEIASTAGGYDVEAGLARFRASIGKPGPGGSGSADPPAAPAAGLGPGSAPLLGKAALLAAAGAMVAGLAFVALRPAPPPRLLAPRVVASVAEAPSAPAPTQPVPQATSIAVESLPDVESVRPRAAAPSAPAPSAAAEPAPAVREGLAAENELMAELRRAPPGRALGLVLEGRTRFPRGVHATEREAAYIRALVALGRRGEGAAAFRSFSVQYPNSPALAELRALVGAPEPERSP